MSIDIISAEQAADIEARLANLEKWIVASGHWGKNGWTSYPSGSEPEDCKVTNEERSQLEVRRFMLEKPERYFMYITRNSAGTWTAQNLGSVTFGREYKCPAFGRASVRVPVTIKAINGETYVGTYYKSSGDYARVKRVKSK